MSCMRIIMWMGPVWSPKAVPDRPYLSNAVMYGTWLNRELVQHSTKQWPRDRVSPGHVEPATLSLVQVLLHYSCLVRQNASLEPEPALLTEMETDFFEIIYFSLSNQMGSLMVMQGHLLSYVRGILLIKSWLFSMNLSLSNQITHTDFVNQSEASKSELVLCLYMKVNKVSLLVC